ncbi:hypothetical protein VSU16_11935 (plasmid) [Cetobacterium somerae]|uniref:hypothetical protein n=2 Tax=Cetobacterium somerae TaxID=188913 RepID=UPI002E7BE1BE|nr:hypothetical protein [Cetobacterium somerae]WVJ02228.1 hypothetical protein VSU16_11935 [Cetobacterium somerae]
MNNKIPNDSITASANLSHFGNNEVSLVLDGNLETVYASNGSYPTGSYGDIYFKLPQHRVLEKIDFYTSNLRGWGLIQSFEVLYKNNISTADWISVFRSSNWETSEGLRTAEFSPIFANEICIRVHGSNGRFITMNEISFYSSLMQELNILTFFDEINGDFILSDFLTLAIIDEVQNDIKDFPELYNVSEIVKYLFFSKMTTIKYNEVAFSENNSITIDEFCNTLKIVKTAKLNSLGMFVKNSKNVIFISNSNCEIVCFEDRKDFHYNRTIKLVKGINRVFIPKSGELFLIGDLNENIYIKGYGFDETNVFKMGESKFNQFLNLQNGRKNMFIEGKNFIANIDINWIKNNFDEHRFLDTITTIDAYYDYLYAILDTPLYFDKNIVKRLLWQGDSEEKVGIKNTDIGSILNFGGDASLFFKNGIHNFATPLICRLTAEEMVSNKFFSKELSDLLKLGFYKTFEFKYNKVLALTGENKKDIFIKIMLYSNSDRFITRLFRKYYTYEFSENENPLDKLALWLSELICRNVASLFIQKGYTLSQDTINLCNKYPNLFLDIDNITFENHKEFFRRERELFNQYYLNRIQQEVTR